MLSNPIISSSTTNAPESGTDAASEAGIFYDKDLDLRFEYPVEMRTEDPLEEMRRGQRNVYGVSAKNDPEHQQAERCMLPLFYAELSGDKAPQRPADLGEKSFKWETAPGLCLVVFSDRTYAE